MGLKNRSEESKNTYLLKDVARVKSNDSAYTAIRPSRILHSEKLKRQLQKYYKNTILTLSVHF